MNVEAGREFEYGNEKWKEEGCELQASWEVFCIWNWVLAIDRKASQGVSLVGFVSVGFFGRRVDLCGFWAGQSLQLELSDADVKPYGSTVTAPRRSDAGR